MSFEKTFKHIDLVQSVISRMSANSFLLKGWDVTLVSALVALGASASSRSLVAVCFIPTVSFWILDSYYLWQERIFREIYKAVITKSEEQIDFSVDPTVFRGKVGSWFMTMFSATEFWFYLPILSALGIALWKVR